MANTSPNNISYPTNASTKKPIEGHIQDTADSVQTALNTKANLSGATFTGAITAKGVTSQTPAGLTTFSVSDDVSGQIELGRQDGTAGSPYIDFHSGATATDYDARIQVSGGNGVNGKATMFLTADRTSLAGRLNLPDQPMFVANGTGGSQNAVANTPIIFSSAQVNQGNGYNTSNGRFTAPLAGKYFMYAILYTFAGTSSKSLAFRKNGSDFVVNDTVLTYSGTNGDLSMSLTYIFNLAASDYIEVGPRINSTTIGTYNAHSWFMGYMIG